MFRSSSFLLLLVLACAVVVPAQAVDSNPDLDNLQKQNEALQAQVEALQLQVKALQAQVQILSARLPGAPAPARPPSALPAAGNAPTPDAVYEREAQALIDGVIRLTDQGDADGARAKIVELRAKYGASKVAGQATYFSNEIEVIGKNAPTDWGIATWFQGKDAADLSGKPTTLVIFWEEWCPHCRDEMPKLQQLYAAHKAQGLRMLGITTVTQTSTDDKVRAYLDQNKIGFPVGKEAGTASTYFNVKGIPAAAIVKGGKIVWRGHPIRLTDEIVKRWL